MDSALCRKNEISYSELDRSYFLNEKFNDECFEFDLDELEQLANKLEEAAKGNSKYSKDEFVHPNIETKPMVCNEFPINSSFEKDKNASQLKPLQSQTFNEWFDSKPTSEDQRPELNGTINYEDSFSKYSTKESCSLKATDGKSIYLAARRAPELKKFQETSYSGLGYAIKGKYKIKAPKRKGCGKSRKSCTEVSRVDDYWRGEVGNDDKFPIPGSDVDADPSGIKTKPWRADNEKGFVCDKCFKTFSRTTYLWAHYKTHREENKTHTEEDKCLVPCLFQDVFLKA